MTSEASGIHDFDFLLGRWHVRHRRLKDRLVGSHEWVEFDGTTIAHQVLGGEGNMDDNVLNVPGDPYRAVTLRAYDSKNLVARQPHAERLCGNGGSRAVPGRCR